MIRLYGSTSTFLQGVGASNVSQTIDIQSHGPDRFVTVSPTEAPVTTGCAVPQRYPFFVPNESNPCQAAAVLRVAPKGHLVALGTDRVLFDAVQMPQVDQVIAIDKEEQALQFHYLNESVLRSLDAGDLTTYQALRLSPTRELWEKMISDGRRAGRITESDAAALMRDETFVWWKSCVSEGQPWDALYGRQNPQGRFEGVNYILDLELFQVVQSLAHQGRYHGGLLDLTDSTQVQGLVQELEQEGALVSVLDLSNAWENTPANAYLGARAMAGLLEPFSQVVSEESLLMLTKGWWKRPGNSGLVYVGFTFKSLWNQLNQNDPHTGQKNTWLDVARVIERRMGHQVFLSSRDRNYPRGMLIQDMNQW